MFAYFLAEAERTGIWVSVWGSDRTNKVAERGLIRALLIYGKISPRVTFCRFKDVLDQPSAPGSKRVVGRDYGSIRKV